MLHTEFHGNRSIGSREEDFRSVFSIYGHGGHLGNVTSIMLINFYLYVPKSFHVKYGLKWPNSF